MNTGVCDAHNLAWKLAAVLQGRAGPGLLDSYTRACAPACLPALSGSTALPCTSCHLVPGAAPSG
jgi:2-polyprenyl-6-methoxyphenol hydroxylase-like FAD-dependent oxidoreductase